jgi:hypothetical protein
MKAMEAEEILEEKEEDQAGSSNSVDTEVQLPAPPFSRLGKFGEISSRMASVLEEGKEVQ